jgi:hypothetical protein
MAYMHTRTVLSWTFGILLVGGLPALAPAQTPAAKRSAAAAASAAQAAATEALARARTHYNAGRYDEAIDAARAAQPHHADAATLIIGRAGLERYRTTADPADLARAREALRGVDPSALDLRDRVDLVIGLGEALFFDEHYRAAADLFESTLDQGGVVGPIARDQVLDWWATAIDRHVRGLPPDERADAFDRLISRMEEELRRDATSSAAAYWLAAASFARGHVDRAWNAAIAGYVRGLLAFDRGASLRPDLDRLVREAIIPERIRRLSNAGTPEAEQAQAGLLNEWESIKERWERK